MKKILLLIFALISILKLNAQSQCGTDELDAYLKRTNPTYAAERQKMEQEIYSILKNKQNNPNARIGANDCQQPSGVFTIPVVIHVIHKGETIGSGTNISDAQIVGLINGMNDQWRKVTGDGVDMEIQFALAVRDTNNNSTNGITRHDGRVYPRYTANGVHYIDTASIGANEDSIIKKTVWDRNRYINIWIADIRGAGGWASLYGNYTFFVSYNSGSATYSHEMGHTFGLYHTFYGDGSSLGSSSTQCPSNNDCLLNGDLVCDTPPHRVEDCSTTSCAVSGDVQNSFKNYMSYCGDTRFTQGQKDRVRELIYEEYYRNLVMSDGLIPVSTNNEISVNNIIKINPVICQSFDSKLIFKNSGLNTITNIKVTEFIDGAQNRMFNFNTNIIKYKYDTITLASINLSQGLHNIKYAVTEFNGLTSDYNNLNNSVCNTYDFYSLPPSLNNFCYNYENGVMPSNFIFDYSTFYDPHVTPSIQSVTGCSKVGNKCFAYLAWNKPSNDYINDNFYLPSVNLSNDTSAYQVLLKFDYSYVQSKVNNDLQISIAAFNDCDELNEDYIYYNYGQSLATAPKDSINGWIPSSCNHWKTISVNLTPYKGNNSLKLRMQLSGHPASASHLQNFYLDNFCITRKYKIDISTNPAGVGYAGYYNGYQIYDKDSTVAIYAYPENCYSFKNWTENGTVVSTNSDYTFTATRNRNLIANYERTQTSVTLTVNPVNTGTANGSGLYPCDTTIIIRGISKAGYSFKNWTDSLGNIKSTDSIYSVYVSNNRILLTANFKKTNTFDISLEASPIIGGSVSGAGQYIRDTTITVKAIPNAGYAFNGWSEGCIFGTCGVSNNTNYTFQVIKDRHLTANFVLGKKLTLNTNYTNGGTVIGAGYYVPNINVDVSATANPCYDFVNWTENGNIYSAARNTIVQMTSDRTLTANFVPKRYNITLAANPTNGGTVSGAGNFACDSSLTVKAKIKTGYKFTNWIEGSTIVSTDSNYTFLISGARSLKANFSMLTGLKQTAINEISKIYPNPANEILQIEIRSKQNTSFTLNIIDMKGSLLDTKTINNTKGAFNTTFDVSKLAKGNYMLNLYDEDGMASYKFVVQ
jgi:hypothetical protein